MVKASRRQVCAAREAEASDGGRVRAVHVFEHRQPECIAVRGARLDTGWGRTCSEGLSTIRNRASGREEGRRAEAVGTKEASIEGINERACGVRHTLDWIETPDRTPVNIPGLDVCVYVAFEYIFCVRGIWYSWYAVLCMRWVSEFGACCTLSFLTAALSFF